MAQGEVVISTRINTSKAEKDLVKLEQDLEKFNDRGEKLLKQKAEIETNKQNYEYALEQLEKYSDMVERIKAQIEKVKNVKWFDFGERETKLAPLESALERYEGRVQRTQEIVKSMSKEYDKIPSKLSNINTKIKENANSQQRVKNAIEETNAKIVKNQLAQVKQDLGGIGNTTSGIVRKVVKWGLALFSIRSAYNFIRGAVSTLSQSNEQIGADIDYIRWALAQALQPIIEGLIKLAYTFLQYINYIANAWFGVNLFAKASAKSFEKMNKELKGSNKQAKELQKTLTGIDEANVIQKDGSVARTGSTGIPQTDLSQMLGETEIPGWVKWIAENGDTIRDVIIGIVEAVALFKLGKLATDLISVSEGFAFFENGILTLKGAIVTAGIIVLIKGMADALQDFESFIKAPSWDTFKVILGDLSVALTGLGTVLIGLNSSNPFGWVSLGIGLVGDIIGLFDGWFTSTDKEKRALDDSATSAKKLKDAKDALTKTSSEYTQALHNSREATKKLKELQDKYHISGKDLFNMIKLGTKDVTDLTDEELDVYQAYLDNVDAQDTLKDKTNDLRKSQGKLTEQTARHSAAIYKETDAYDDNFKTIISGFDGTQKSVESVRRYIFNMLTNMNEETRRVFIQGLPEDITKAFETPKNIIRVLKDGTEIAYKDIAAGAETTYGQKIPKQVNLAKKAFDDAGKSVDNLKKKIQQFNGMNVKVTVVEGGSSKVGNAVGGIVTKLATGGIINRPGRGVPLGNSIGGEAAREGILPLTDAQAMETLGQAIGRYITLNATVPVYVGNRQIAREIRKIENEEDFAFNN